ncbi:peptidase family C54 [Ancylostoma duodenale]|uniref:Cysteine protease n=1 Tax=Ancylostoma duodenale TaxID=51022 RepID=A0A0C2CQE0_9BILA|nr:peptidase family C54 [Ancylostoma duodenale]
MVDTYLTFEPSFWELQDNTLLETDRPILLLGKKFDREAGIEPIKKYVTSRLWFTYRRNFAPIGGTGPETDQGWGCMLRCAQMLLGEVLLRRHIGRDYEWVEGAPPTGDYERILRMFLDEKTALYSIHQIAQMGVSEGKSVGEWFGPNTAAQVVKKLAVFDSWSNIAVHVALDNILVLSDVRTIATLAPPKDAIKLITEENDVNESYLTLVNESTASDDQKCEWRPLLLLVPLRLGLTTINRCYLPAIELVYLDPHYCRPSIIEKYGNTRWLEDGFDSLESEDVPPSVPTRDEGLDDSTFHCKMLLHMGYDQVDPSLALAFFCESAEAFDKLSRDLQKV